MGADGGVCWMPLRDPKQYARVLELLGPFYYLTKYGNADWQDDANDQFLNSHPYHRPNYLVGTYGSFQDFSIYPALEEILSDEREICIDPSLTFLELMEDLDTRPLFFPEIYMDSIPAQWGFLPSIRASISRLRRTRNARGTYLSTLEIMLWDSMKYYSTEAERAVELCPIAKTNLSDWRDELRSLLDVSLTGREETWT